MNSARPGMQCEINAALGGGDTNLMRRKTTSKQGVVQGAHLKVPAPNERKGSAWVAESAGWLCKMEKF